ncbi:HPr kinase/phosphorylase [Ureibacillus acetophenoni]
MIQVTTKDVMEKFNLTLVSGNEGIGRYITTSDISRPGLEMAGYFTHYPAKRVQLIGKTELSFFDMLPTNLKKERSIDYATGNTPYCRISWYGCSGRTNRNFQRNRVQSYLQR